MWFIFRNVVGSEVKWLCCSFENITVRYHAIERNFSNWRVFIEMGGGRERVVNIRLELVYQSQSSFPIEVALFVLITRFNGLVFPNSFLNSEF